LRAITKIASAQIYSAVSRESWRHARRNAEIRHSEMAIFRQTALLEYAVYLAKCLIDEKSAEYMAEVAEVAVSCLGGQGSSPKKPKKITRCIY
jgi:hypothetical protein